MDRRRILTELALQIEAEQDRGIAFWTEPGWNDAARAFLSPRPAKPKPGAAPVSPASPPLPAAKPKKPPPTFDPPPPATDRVKGWEAQLEAVRREALGCTACGLHKTRRNVVFNSGSGTVPLVFVGEAPGANEDAQGEAFVGRAGELLTKIIAAIGIDRQDVYICNVLKCRPPGNRNPAPEEIRTCAPFLTRQLEILKPRVICTLGLFATQYLLDMKVPIGKLRGRIFRYRNIPLLPTYHPAALLRNPNLKRTVWEDVQLLRKVLDEGSAAPGIEIQATPREKEPARPTSGDLF